MAPSENPAFNTSVLLQNINDIPNMSDSQLRTFIDHYFSNILLSVFTGTQINEHVRCFTDVRFLDAFIDVIQRQKYFDLDVIVKVNNICYDYISLQDPMHKNQDVMNRMLVIANIVNQSRMPRLLGLGLNKNLALMLVMARYSSLNLEICVKRVNFIIITQPKILMTREMITEIFKILYTDRDIWSRIFQYFMFDVIPEYNELDPNSWVTEDIEEINSIMNLVILEILNEQESRVIAMAISTYADTYSIISYGKPVRFSMHRISDDFSRVNDIVEMISIEKYIP